MTSGPVVVQVLEGENAIAKYREVMGATNPANAAEGTIRKLFAKSIGENSVHGSDAPETPRSRSRSSSRATRSSAELRLSAVRCTQVVGPSGRLLPLSASTAPGYRASCMRHHRPRPDT